MFYFLDSTNKVPKWKWPDMFGSLDMIYFVGDSTMKRMFDTFRSRTKCANENQMKGRLHADAELLFFFFYNI